MSRDRRAAPQQSPNFVWEALDSHPREPGAASGHEDTLVVAEDQGAERDGRREPGTRRASGRALIAAAVLVPLAGGSYAVVAYSTWHDDTALVTAQASQAPGLAGSASPGPDGGLALGAGSSASASPRASSKTSPPPSPDRSGTAAAGSPQVRSVVVTTLEAAPGKTPAASAGAPTAPATHAAAPPAGPPTGPIVGYEGLCLDDRGATVVNYNPIQVHTCNNTDAEQWTLESDYTVQVFGMCLDVYAAGTTGGTKVDLYQCNGTKAQTWVAQPDGALVNPESGMCLDDTEFGGTGTQVEIWTCNGGSDQVWRLP